MEHRSTTLIFAPHIDDEVLGCYSWLDRDAHVVWFGVVDPETEEGQGIDRETRLEEAAAVSRSTGFSFTLGSEPVNRFDVKSILAIAEHAIAEYAPRYVLLPCPSYNQDHRAVFDAVHTAVRPSC